MVKREVFTFSICHFPFNAKWKTANVKWAMLAVTGSLTTQQYGMLVALLPICVTFLKYSPVTDLAGDGSLVNLRRGAS